MNSTLKFLLVSGLILAMPVGCAARRRPLVTPAPVAAPKPPPPAPPPAPPPKQVKLVLLPVEKFLLPNVATSLDEKLIKTEVPGVNDRVVAAISMETAQGQAGCFQADNDCYAKVANLLGGDRLLWVEMDRGKKAKKKAPVRVIVNLFDVEKGAVVGRAEETLKSDVVDGSLDAMIGRALLGGGPTAPPPTTASPAPPPPPPPPPPPSARPSPAAAHPPLPPARSSK